MEDSGSMHPIRRRFRRAPSLLPLLSSFLFRAAVSPLQASFQDVQWGARPAGMGGAYVGIGDDVNALSYNPAGTARVSRIQSSFMYAKPMAGLDQVNLNKSFFAAVVPMSKGNTLGFSWTNLIAPNYRENVASLSYAAALDRLAPAAAPAGASVGVELNYLSHEFILNDLAAQDLVFKRGRRAAAYALGLSFTAMPASDLFPGIRVGGAGRYLNDPDVGLQSQDRVPRELALGVGLPRGNARFDVDAVRRGDVTTVRAGAEVWVLSSARSANQFVLRGGGDLNAVSAGMTLGRLRRDRDGRPLFGLGLDYAFMLPLNVENTAGSHMVALGVQF